MPKRPFQSASLNKPLGLSLGQVQHMRVKRIDLPQWQRFTTCLSTQRPSGENDQHKRHRGVLEQGTEAAPRGERVSLKCEAGCHSQTADVLVETLEMT